jgi:hypothetical protein
MRWIAAACTSLDMGNPTSGSELDHEHSRTPAAASAPADRMRATGTM